MLVEGSGMSATVSVDGPGELSVQYVFQDPATGEIIASGPAEAASGGTFRVNVSADVADSLAGDLYHLYVAAYSDELSTLLEQRVDVEFGEAMEPTEEAQPTAQAEATPTAAPTDDGDAEDGGSATLLITAIAAAAVLGLVLGLALLIMRSRRGPQ